MVIAIGNGLSKVQNLAEAVCISHSVNATEKGLHPNILLPVMDEIVGQTGFFNLGMATRQRERKLN